MMNKKGVSIGRIILYVIFLTLLGVLIYGLYVTFKACKKSKIEPNTSIRLAYPTPPQGYYYSCALDSIDDSYFVFYNYRDFVYERINGTLRNVDINSYTANKSIPFYSLYAYDIDTDDLIHTDSSYYYYFDSSRFENVLNIDDSLFDNVSTIKDFGVVGHDLPNYFNEYKSASLIYNFHNVPIQYFNFSLDLSSNSNTGFHFFIVDNMDHIHTCVLTSDNNWSFNASTDITLSSGVDSISQLIFPFWQTQLSSGISYYPLSGTLNYNYNYFTNQSNRVNFYYKFNFDYYLVERDSTYIEGYNAGYQDGLSAADSNLKSQVASLNSQIASLQNSNDDLSSRISEQSIIIANLQNQLNNASNNFKGLFFTIADVPFKTVSNVLGFEVLGVNLFKFFTGVLTALGILWLIKKIIK